MPDPKSSILFVCLGNICRSPLAEGIFLHAARQRSVADRFTVDSCGTGGWHVGERPDKRARAVAKKNGVELPSLARTLDAPRDFERFHWIIPMDRQNKADLLDAGAPKDRTRLFRSFDPALASAPESDIEVPDPYWGGDDGFDQVFRMISDACEGMLAELGT